MTFDPTDPATLHALMGVADRPPTERAASILSLLRGMREMTALTEEAFRNAVTEGAGYDPEKTAAALKVPLAAFEYMAANQSTIDLPLLYNALDIAMRAPDLDDLLAARIGKILGADVDDETVRVMLDVVETIERSGLARNLPEEQSHTVGLAALYARRIRRGVAS